MLRSLVDQKLALSIVDLAGAEGPLGFYIAEQVNKETIQLTHRDGGEPPLHVDAHVFDLRYRLALCGGTPEHDSGSQVLAVLRELLPDLCEGCGRVVATGSSCCSACRDRQVADLLRMTDTDRSSR